MKKKSNGIVIVLSSLMVICLACGMLGLYASMKPANKKPEEDKNKDFKVAYRYYLDGIEVNKMIEQEYIEENGAEFEGATTKKPAYSFEKYTCTNNVTGEWNEEKWEFKPNLTANATCRLYFLKNTHEVTIKVNNGKLPATLPEGKVKADLNKETKVNVLPNDGYQYDKVECTNEVIAEYDANTKDLKISNVKKDSMCTVSFKINDYKIEVKASYGTVSGEAKTARYGDNVVFEVTPAENHRFDVVTCTNGQNASYVDGKLTVQGITNDTICTVQFKPIKYSVSLTVEGGTLISGYTSPQSVSEGQKATFVADSIPGYDKTGAEIYCGDDIHAEFQAGVVFIYDVRRDLNCTLKFKKSAETN